MKPIELFPFQEDFANDIHKAFRRERRVIGQAATGFGKGVVIAELAARSIKKGKVLCIACHRIEILESLFKNLRKFGIFPSLITAGNTPMPGAQCYLGMVETVCRRMNKGVIQRFNIDFFILDEIHWGSYYKLVIQLEQYVLGLTATPKETPGKQPLKSYFGDLVQGIPISELINIGRLVPVKTFSIQHDFSKVKKKGSEFSDRELFKEFKKPKLRQGAVDAYMQHAQGLPALFYCVNVEHSHETVRQLISKGVRAAHVDGETNPDVRKTIFKMHEDAELDVISNVGIATTGTDMPYVRCIAKNYATLSITKDVQTGGRGGRCIIEEYPGWAHLGEKKEFICIDAGMNYIRFGEFGEEIDWRFIFNNPCEEIKKPRGKRRCEECGGVISIQLQTCPYCGSFTSKKEIDDKMLLGCTLEEIREYKLSQLPPHLRKKPSELSKNELFEYARIMHYNPKWVHIQMKFRK